MTSLTGHAPVRPQSQAAGARAAEAQVTVSVGMAVALAAVLMTFAAMLLAYAILRVQAPSWPPAGEQRPPSVWPWPTVATLLALLGSAAMLDAERSMSRSEGTPPRAVRLSLLCAAGAGLAFVTVQIAAWSWLVRVGVRPDSGLVASVVYGLTVFHGVHALAAVLVLLPLLVRSWRRRSVTLSSLRAVSSFWHLVTVLWVVVFLAVFVA